MTALLTPYGAWVQPPRHQDKGPAPKPHWMPLPQLLYVQTVKTVRRRRLVRVRHRVVFGTLAAIEHVLAPLGWQSNTAFDERINLDICLPIAAVRQQVTTRYTGEDCVRQQLALYHVYHNICLPHASVRQALPLPEPMHGTGTATRWCPQTRTMAAGLTKSGRHARCCCIGDRRGRSQQTCEQAVVVGSGTERRPEVATCTCTACGKGVSTVQGATVMP